MKALTIHQPWASFIADGLKDIENRYWQTTYRGPLVIHSGKSLKSMNPAKRFVANIEGVQVRRTADLHFGQIIAVVDLVDIVENDPSQWAESGCFNWKLENAVRLPKPIKTRGHMGLFVPDPKILEMIKEQI